MTIPTTIDVRSALRAVVASATGSSLVTRPTGALVRALVEQQIAGLADGTVVYLDFTHIRVLDRSCADEFLGKLIRPLADGQPDDGMRHGYVVINGLAEEHLDAIEGVLERYELALVVQLADGAARLIGKVNELERRVWELVMLRGAADAAPFADEMGLPTDEALRLLDSLARRRLLRREADRFVPLGAVA